MSDYGRPNLGSGGAERAARAIEKQKSQRRRGVSEAMEALRSARGRSSPGKLAEALKRRK